ncbi:hypothetical protein PULV_a3949 [Pseudoalteromonas ulvae UL12]|uniref:helicase HerA domain-containing protein n=1 Tax=Pseudoalteromonas ulvae TaxID=107327 RepID=UPI00186B89BC|nr:DUF87 domain-containing protein [Pseudoalteromonas ulvae]MBE0362144.1 hypothetical protein [Pseudoalteromonas ulvae UL12]
MKARLGIHNNAMKAWNYNEITTPHIVISGKTGSGKTHLLRRLLNDMVNTAPNPVRVHIFDVHDDLAMPNESEVMFSQSSSYGMNVLDIDPNPHSGGPRRAISELIAMMGKTTTFRLGARQEPVFRNILLQLYEKNGFYPDKPSSWPVDDGITRRYPKKIPTLTDAFNFSNYQLNLIETGCGGGALKALKELKSAQLKRVKLIRSTPKDGLVDIEGEIEALKTKSISAYNDFIMQSSDGKEQEMLKLYDEPSVLKAVIDRISNLHNMRVFSGESPPFNMSANFWRYRLKHLTVDQSKMFVLAALKRLFMRAVRKGEQSHITDIIVVDEFKRYADDEQGSIFDMISLEARKFGLMLVTSSQSHRHFPSDLLKSSGLSIVLQQDPLDYTYLKNNCLLEKEQLEKIKPRHSALFRMSTLAHSGSQHELITISDNDIISHSQGQRTQTIKNEPASPKLDSSPMKHEKVVIKNNPPPVHSDNSKEEDLLFEGKSIEDIISDL